MRVVFIATGDISIPAFRHLLERRPMLLALVTQPDKRAGRRQIVVSPAVKQLAMAAGIPVLQPEKIGDAVEELAAMKPDVLVVMAYGQILRDDILHLPKRAIINLHASLLPKYRGAACIQAAIDAGDVETGITSMHVVRELDAGDIILKQALPIAPDETGGTLHDKLAVLAVDVLDETLSLIEAGNASRFPQNSELSSYVPKLDRDDGRLDWSLPAVELERRIRAYDPWPGTFTMAQEGGGLKRVKIFPPVRWIDRDLKPGVVDLTGGTLIVGCGRDALEITALQVEGGRKMDSSEYLRGNHPEAFV